MHRRSAYPPGHPLRFSAQAEALDAVAVALATEPEFAISVAKNQLKIGTAFTEPNNPALAELAERLHRRGVGTITLRAGVTAAEFEVLLERISSTNTPADEEDDLLDETPQPSAHVGVEMLSYDGLALADELEDETGGPDGTGDRLWRQLAEVALVGWDGVDGAGFSGGGSAAEADIDRAFDSLFGIGSGDGRGDGNGDGSRPGSDGAGAGDGAGPEGAGAGGEGTGSVGSGPVSGTERESGAFGAIGAGELPPEMNPQRIARAISARARDGAPSVAVLKSLLRVARHARRRGRAGGGAVAARLREVLRNLDPGTMATLLASEVDPVRKRVLILQGVDALPVSAVLDWIEAAAQSADKSISHHLLRLLKKVAAQTRRRRDGGADDGGETLRQAARQLVDGWQLEIHQSEEHDTLLTHIAAYEDAAGDETDAGESVGAERVMQIALETDVIGHDVMAAADELVDARRLGVLLSLLDRVERSDVAAPAVRAHLLSAEMLRHILLNEPVELDAAHRLLELCDVAHAESMLDALSLSESPTTRQLVLQRLRELGDVIREQVVARLGDADWYVLRNLLALLGAMRTLPARLSIDAYFRHDEPTVRVEALRLLVRMPDRRETAVHDALLDHDPRVLRAALDAAASHGLPRRSGARLLQVVEKADRDNDLRVRGIALLPQAPTNLARDWLFKLVLRRRGFFRRWALQDPSSEQLAALRALAAGWRADPAVARALALAVASRDPQVREAVNALAAR